MKITTLNLQGFDNWEVREAAILAHLESESPDVVLFQEAVFLPEISPYNQAQLLNTRLKYPYEHSVISRLQTGHDHPVYREGLAVLSRYPIARSDALSLTRARGDEHQRIVQLFDISFDEHVVKLANVHFSITDNFDFATPHLQETLAILRARGEQRIIAGDFNLNNLDASSHLWQDDYVASTVFDYVSFPDEHKRIDYFLVPNSYSLSTITTSGNNLSDRRAVTATINLLEVRPRTRHRHQLSQTPSN